MVHGPCSMELTRTIYLDNIEYCAVRNLGTGRSETPNERKIHEQRIPLALSVLELSSLSCLERTGTWTGNGIRIDGYSMQSKVITSKARCVARCGFEVFGSAACALRFCCPGLSGLPHCSPAPVSRQALTDVRINSQS